MTPNTSLPPKLFNYKEAARYLGVHVASLRRMVSERRIACYHVAGGRVRFSEQQLAEALQEQPAIGGKR